jgi:hypothetical protein
MPLIFTQVDSDNFHRPNEQPLHPAKWTVSTVEPSPNADAAIVNDVCVAGMPNLDGVEFYTGAPVSSDQFIAAVIDQFQYDAVSALNLVARSDVAYQNLYYASLFQKKLELSIYVNNVETPLGVVDIPAVNRRDVVQLSLVGKLISVSYNGVVMIAVENGAIASGLVGFEIGSSAVQTDTAVSLLVVGNVKIPSDHSSVG